MAFKVKKCWVTDHGALNSLTIEALVPERPEMHIESESRVFPFRPTDEHPLRQVAVLHGLSDEDLLIIKEAIENFLRGNPDG